MSDDTGQKNDDLEHLRSLVDRMKVGMLTTVDGKRLRSRPLHTQDFDADGNLWFFIGASSPKVDEMAFNGNEVNLSYADSSKYDFVSISGSASLVRDKAKIAALWTKAVELWFPKGIDDPNVALLRIKVESAEYWESPGSAVGRALAFAKAMVTGDTSSIKGRDRKVDLAH